MDAVSRILVAAAMVWASVAAASGPCGTHGHRCMDATHFSICLVQIDGSETPTAAEYSCPIGMECDVDAEFICVEPVSTTSAGNDVTEVASEGIIHVEPIPKESSVDVAGSKVSAIEVVTGIKEIEISTTELVDANQESQVYVEANEPAIKPAVPEVVETEISSNPEEGAADERKLPPTSQAGTSAVPEGHEVAVLPNEPAINPSVPEVVKAEIPSNPEEGPADVGKLPPTAQVGSSVVPEGHEVVVDPNEPEINPPVPDVIKLKIQSNPKFPPKNSAQGDVETQDPNTQPSGESPNQNAPFAGDKPSGPVSNQEWPQVNIETSEAEYECPDSGRFPAPPSCTRYHVCYRFFWIRKHFIANCEPGLEFSPSRKRCVHNRKSDCASRQRVEEDSDSDDSDESDE